MWFKNLRLYQLTEDFTHTPEALAEALAAHPFKPCGSQELSRSGWVPPAGEQSEDYVHASNGFIMVCAKRQDKILPAAVVNEQLEERIADIRAEEGRPVGRKERQNLKDDILLELLPRAFRKSSRDYAFIAPQQNLILVNSSSAKRAEDLLSQLRESLGSLKAIPLTPQLPTPQVMTHWLRGEPLPADFELGEECELQAGKDSRVIRCKNLDLGAPEITSHLDSGMFASRLALSWKEAIHFVLDDQFALKRLKFDDRLLEQAQDSDPESAAEAFDADFAVMSLELVSLVKDLLAAFGGAAEH